MRTVEERFDEGRDFTRVHRTVAVESHDDVASSGSEAARQGEALADPLVEDNLHIAAKLLCDLDRVVR